MSKIIGNARAELIAEARRLPCRGAADLDHGGVPFERLCPVLLPLVDQ